MGTPTLTIDIDKKCAECGKSGVVDSGICLGCATKAIQGKPMRSRVGRLVQQQMREKASDIARKRL